MIYVLLILAFSGAVFEVLPFGASIQKTILLLLISFGLAASRASWLSKSSVFVILPFLYYLFYCSLSAYWVSGSLLFVLFAVTPLLLGPAFYFYLVSRYRNASLPSRASSFFLVICVIQIVFSLIKYFVHGIDEKVLIGTMSNVAGQLGFLFPSIALPILVYCFKGKRKAWMWLLVVSLALFGLINEKRSVFFLFPFILFFSIQANSAWSPKSLSTSKIFPYVLVIAISFLVFFGGVALIPSLNHSFYAGGSHSLLSPLLYSIDYLTMDYGGNLQGSYQEALANQNIQVGRVTLVFSILSWFFQSSLSIKLFGVGFGVATPSEWIGGATDPLFSILGTRGAISTAGLALIETGLIGFSLLILFFVNVYLLLRSKIVRSRTVSAYCWYRTTEVLFFVFLYDFFFYSTLLFRTLPMPLIFFGAISSLSGAASHRFLSSGRPGANIP